MAFLDALRGWTGQAGPRDADPRRWIEASGEEGTSHPEFPGRVPAATPEEMAAPADPSDYDREQWRKKLRRILTHLPRSQGEWADLAQEGGALEFDPSWMAATFREEFTMMVRKIVSDRVVTPEEHHRVDVARSLLGIPDDEATAIFRDVVTDAEGFFGQSVQGA